MQCPHCKGVCQVLAEHLGTVVKCGTCGQTFRLPPAAAPPAPAPPPAPPAPPARPPGPPAPAEAPSGFWSGLRGLVRTLTSPLQTSSAPATPSPDTPASDEDEIGIVLDGPAAAALDNPSAQTLPAAGPTAACRLDIGGATSTGLARARNEDSFLVVQFTATNLDRRRDAALVVVADGVGGEDAGDRASGLTVQSLAAALLPSLTALPAVHGQDSPPAGLGEQIAEAIRAANHAVHDAAEATPGCKGMAATAAVLVLWEGQAYVGHVGDCRVYHHDGAGVKQVTRDQTLVARMVETGTLSPAEALAHPKRNEVLQAVGKRPEIHPGSYELKVSPGDWLVVACDGLHAHVNGKALADVLNAAAPSAAAVAQQLVDLANEGGGSDNCTVVAVRCY
jgi:predicted Zn finger-like uncharacterized protein